MKYLALPFILALGIVELLLRVTCMLVLSLGTLCIIPIMLHEDRKLNDLLTPVSFRIAERIAAS